MEDTIEIQRIKSADKDQFEKIVAIRKEVFVDEQHVNPEEEFDEFEEESTHYLLLVNGQPIATARWRFIGPKIKCERFALLSTYRNNGYGSQLLQNVLTDVINLGKEVYLHAQLKAIPFYERQGFIKVGEQFEECEILHYKMVLNT